VPSELKKKISQARLEKKMTQAQLAQVSCHVELACQSFCTKEVADSSELLCFCSK